MPQPWINSPWQYLHFVSKQAQWRLLVCISLICWCRTVPRLGSLSIVSAATPPSVPLCPPPADALAFVWEMPGHRCDTVWTGASAWWGRRGPCLGGGLHCQLGSSKLILIEGLSDITLPTPRFKWQWRWVKLSVSWRGPGPAVYSLEIRSIMEFGVSYNRSFKQVAISF